MTKEATAYLSRGVSPTKDDVHAALRPDPNDVEPGAFCKLIADFSGDPAYRAAMHADGAGTKSALAYLYYKETGDLSVFRGIAQDAIVMNIDDLACIGATDKFIFSNTIGRNAHRVDGAVIKEIIDGYHEFAELMRPYGIEIELCGGETADVGDLVATLIVDSTVYVRLLRDKIVNCRNIKPGDVIIGLASDGQSTYEKAYNSGMGSNGLTAARHIMLKHEYAQKYPETYSPTIDAAQVYCGPYAVTDILPGTGISPETGTLPETGILPGAPEISVGKALLSPTRTYLPLLKELLSDEQVFQHIHGIIHNTGGGQIKCKKFGYGLHYIKDNLFPTPPLFQAIQAAAKLPASEMLQIFNVGYRMEFYCDPAVVPAILAAAERFHIGAQIVGSVEANDSADSKNGENKVTVRYQGETITF